MKAIVISIGDELLIGQTINTNASWMGKELNAIGVDLVEVITISDQKSAIVAAMEAAGKKANVVLITGGLGPTKDDITKKTFSEYFNAPLVQNERALENIQAIFARFGRELQPVHYLQALVPSGCKMLLNKAGTAPGMWMADESAIYVSMPGVPREMQYLMQNEVLPRLQKMIGGSKVIIHKTLMTQGEGESWIAERLEDIEDNLPQGIKLAYLPSSGMVKLRVTGKGEDEASVRNAVEFVAENIAARISDCLYSEDEASLEAVIGSFLLNNEQTIATAESCTSGALAARLTSVAGASAYVKGGVVSYTNEIKIQELGVDPQVLEAQGAVCETVAIQMAQGVREKFQTDYAISTTGIAGPDGGTEQTPVGTVWIGVSAPNGSFAKKFNLGSGRQRVVERAVLSGMMTFLKAVQEA